MSNDPWRELAQVNRETQSEERDRLGERWDRLSSSELSPEEEAELRALAETSEENREAYEAFRPLGPDFHASVVQAVREQGLAREAESAAPKPWAKLLPLPQRATRFAGWSAVAGAAAAAVLVLLLRTPASLPPLPTYTAELSGGVETLRGGEPDPASGLPVFVSGSLLTLKTSPPTAVAGPVEARGFLSPGLKGEIVPWKPEPSFKIYDNGVVLLRGTLGQEIQLSPGSWTIWIVVGRPGRIPSASELLAELRTGRTRHADWQAVCVDLSAGVARHEQWQVACANLRVEDQPPP